MIDFIASFDLSSDQWIWVLVCGLSIGMAKAGISGLGMFVVPVLASIFGAKDSTGVLLPMLIMVPLFNGQVR